MQILQRALITEKANGMNEGGTYAFIVDRKANKFQIKKAVQEMYNITVTDVRTVNALGKMKSKHTKTGLVSGRRASVKKAYVSIAKDDFIDIYENA